MRSCLAFFLTGRVVTVQKIKQIKLFGKLFNGISLEFYSKQSSENLGPKMWSDESLLVNDQIDHPYKEKKNLSMTNLFALFLCLRTCKS